MKTKFTTNAMRHLNKNYLQSNHIQVLKQNWHKRTQFDATVDREGVIFTWLAFLTKATDLVCICVKIFPTFCPILCNRLGRIFRHFRFWCIEPQLHIKECPSLPNNSKIVGTALVVSPSRLKTMSNTRSKKWGRPQYPIHQPNYLHFLRNIQGS